MLQGIPLQQYLPFTVLKLLLLAPQERRCALELQQYLPFTVLKPSLLLPLRTHLGRLQQYLPFTVLKQRNAVIVAKAVLLGCNSTYRLRY